jgi:hypothetical protein
VLASGRRVPAFPPRSSRAQEAPGAYLAGASPFVDGFGRSECLGIVSWRVAGLTLRSLSVLIVANGEN